VTLILAILGTAVRYSLGLVVVVVILWGVGVLMPIAVVITGGILSLYGLNPRTWTEVGVAYPLRSVVVLIVTVVVVALVAPARAFAVYTMQFYPVGGADINFFAVPGLYYVGAEHLPLIDQIWGAVAALLYGFVFARLAMWDRVRARQLRTLTPGPIASLAQGLVKVQGTVRTLLSSNEPAVLSFDEQPGKTTWAIDEVQASFYLEDETGGLLVIIDGANILPRDGVVEDPWGLPGSPLTIGAREIHLNRARKGKEGPHRFGLSRGDPATVIGRVERNPAYGTDEPGNEAENRIRPSTGGFFRPVYYNMFLVADELGDGVSRHLRRRARHSVLIGLLFAAGSLWLLTQGVAAETDFVAVYGVSSDAR
jgi:hypothetical protein